MMGPGDKKVINDLCADLLRERERADKADRERDELRERLLDAGAALQGAEAAEAAMREELTAAEQRASDLAGRVEAMRAAVVALMEYAFDGKPDGAPEESRAQWEDRVEAQGRAALAAALAAAPVTHDATAQERSRCVDELRARARKLAHWWFNDESPYEEDLVNGITAALSAVADEARREAIENAMLIVHSEPAYPTPWTRSTVQPYMDALERRGPVDTLQSFARAVVDQTKKNIAARLTALLPPTGAGAKEGT